MPPSPLRDRPFFTQPLPLPLSISSEASAVCLSLTSQVSQKIPTSLSSTSSFSNSFSSSYRGLSHAQVTVLPQSYSQSPSQSKISGGKTGPNSSSSSPKPSPHSSYSLASNMSIELHYATPLSEVVTSQSLAAYNDILRFLLPISTAKWAADSAWIRCMRSDLFSKGREKSQFREEKKKRVISTNIMMMDNQEVERDRIDEHEFSLKGREKEIEKEKEKERYDYLNRAKCRAGMSLMIHTLSVLQTHYMGIIHGHILPIYLDAPSHTSASSLPSTSASISVPTTTITSSSSSRHTPFHSAAFPVASSPSSAPPTSFSLSSLPFSCHLEAQKASKEMEEVLVEGKKSRTHLHKYAQTETNSRRRTYSDACFKTYVDSKEGLGLLDMCASVFEVRVQHDSMLKSIQAVLIVSQTQVKAVILACYNASSLIRKALAIEQSNMIMEAIKKTKSEKSGRAEKPEIKGSRSGVKGGYETYEERGTHETTTRTVESRNGTSSTGTGNGLGLGDGASDMESAVQGAADAFEALRQAVYALVLSLSEVWTSCAVITFFFVL